MAGFEEEIARVKGAHDAQESAAHAERGRREQLCREGATHLLKTIVDQSNTGDLAGKLSCAPTIPGFSGDNRFGGTIVYTAEQLTFDFSGIVRYEAQPAIVAANKSLCAVIRITARASTTPSGEPSEAHMVEVCGPDVESLRFDLPTALVSAAKVYFERASRVGL